MILLLYIQLCLASRFALASLLLALKKGAAMNPQLQEDECWQQPHQQGSMPFPAELPDENRALADTLTAALGDLRQRTQHVQA